MVFGRRFRKRDHKGKTSTKEMTPESGTERTIYLDKRIRKRGREEGGEASERGTIREEGTDGFMCSRLFSPKEGENGH